MPFSLLDLWLAAGGGLALVVAAVALAWLAVRGSARRRRSVPVRVSLRVIPGGESVPARPAAAAEPARRRATV